MLSRICEEFGLSPSAAREEDWEEVSEIMGLRGFAEAVRAVESPSASEENTTEWQREAVFDVIEEITRLKG